MTHRSPLTLAVTLKSTLAALLILAAAVACSPSTPVAKPEPSATFTLEPTTTATPSPTHTPVPTATSTPTGTPLPTTTPTPEPTATSSPTQTPVPTTTPTPTSTPSPSEIASAPNTVTVCAVGCDFTTIQAAIDDTSTLAGYVIYVTDAVHTEAGITVHKDVTIQGRGADHSIVQAHEEAGEATDRVFFIAQGATATIKELTIQHGSPTEGIRSGGGIENRGTLTLVRCIVRDNLANCGGGIYNEGGTLTVINCTIRDNVADGEAPPGYGCGSGGAIKVTEGGTLTLTDSTLSDNHAHGKGGGLHISCRSSAVLSNCTISGNHAVARGGGINAGGTLTLTHCTIAGNSAKGISRGKRVSGRAAGGLAALGTLHYSNTLIANNPKDGDCVLGSNGVIGTNVHNLVEDNGCNPAYSGDPKLDDLADNGGDTQTRALLPGSLALDAIPAGDCSIELDQRGEPRPVAQTSTDTACDIGAFELQAE